MSADAKKVHKGEITSGKFSFKDQQGQKVQLKLAIMSTKVLAAKDPEFAWKGKLVDLEWLTKPGNAQDLGSDDEDIHAGKWPCARFLLTHDSQAVENSTNIVDVKAGEEVYVPATARLRKQIEKFVDAHDENGKPVMYELAFQCAGNTLLKGGRTIQEFEMMIVGVEPRLGRFLTTEFRQEKAIQAARAQAASVGHLPQGVNAYVPTVPQGTVAAPLS